MEGRRSPRAKWKGLLESFGKLGTGLDEIGMEREMEKIEKGNNLGIKMQVKE